MKSNVSPIVIAIAVVVAVALIGFLGWKQMKPPPALNDQAPPSFIDPVTHRPKGDGGGSGMPKQATNGAPASQPAGGQ
jgi:hypothetical protein